MNVSRKTAGEASEARFEDSSEITWEIFAWFLLQGASIF
jgi:hypothetical protein